MINNIAKTSVLPFHTRTLPKFKTALNADAAQVIQAMDRMDDDIPEQRPGHQIALPSVGVQRTHVPIRVLDPFGSQQITTIFCDIALSTTIPPDKRGIHMSRIGSLVADATEDVYEDLQQFASYLALELNSRQHGGPSEVTVSGTYSFIESVQGWKPEKDKRSLEHIRLHAHACADYNDVSESAGLTVAHITACPCVQQTYKHALLQCHGNVEQAIELTSPLFTHSQRCETHVQLKNLPNRFPMKKLLECLDQVLIRTQNTLPREYELLMVYRAHSEPQFIEDATRQVLSTLHSLLMGDEYAASSISVHSTSMESIHDFDITSECTMTMSELDQIFGNTHCLQTEV